MRTIRIRYLTGARAGQTESFAANPETNLLVGREANCPIRFDMDHDDLVSRNHARITGDPDDPNAFHITDLQSRNGTFLNRYRTFDLTRLNHGDVIQLGPAGPEFTFELDPPPPPNAKPPKALPKPTRAGTPNPTQTMEFALPPGMPASAMPRPDSPKVMGRATVERMIGDVARQLQGQNRRTTLILLITILCGLLAAAGYWIYEQRRQADQRRILLADQEKLNLALQRIAEQQQQASNLAREAAANIERLKAEAKSAEAALKNPEYLKYEAMLRKANEDLRRATAETARIKGQVAQILENQAENQTKAPTTIDTQALDSIKRSLLLVEVSWRLVDSASGKPYYHLMLPNAIPGSQARLCEGGEDLLPVFIRGESPTPALTTDPHGGVNRLVGGNLSATGLFVGKEGQFLTSRSALQAFQQPYAFPAAKQAILLNSAEDSACMDMKDLSRSWVPAANAPVVIDSIQVKSARRFDFEAQRNRSVYGVNLFLEVVIPSRERVGAHIVRESREADVILVQMDGGKPGPPANLTVDAPLAAGPVFIAGIPAPTPPKPGTAISAEDFRKRVAQRMQNPPQILAVQAARNAALNGLPAPHGWAGAPVLNAGGQWLGICKIQPDGDAFVEPLRAIQDLIPR